MSRRKTPTLSAYLTKSRAEQIECIAQQVARCDRNRKNLPILALIVTVLALGAALYLDQLTGADDPAEEAPRSQPAAARPLVLIIEERDAPGAAVVDEIERHLSAEEAAGETAESMKRLGEALAELGELAEPTDLAQSQFNLRLTILIAAVLVLPFALFTRSRAGEQQRILTLYRLHLKPAPPTDADEPKGHSETDRTAANTPYRHVNAMTALLALAVYVIRRRRTDS